MTFYTRTLLWLLSALMLPVSASGQVRRNVVVLPFSAGHDQAWLSTATARTLAGKLERTGQLRPLKKARLDELGAAIGIDIRQAGELPIPALRRVGRWLNTDVLIIGRVGNSHERERARELIGSTAISKEVPEGAEMWLAARLYGYPEDVSLGSAFVEGAQDGLFELYDGLTQQILDRLGVVETRALRAYGRPTHTVDAFRFISEAIEAVGHATPDEQARRFAAEALRRALRLDPDYGDAHLLEGSVLQSQGDTSGAKVAFGLASALDPKDPRPRWSLAALARAHDDPAGEISALMSVLEAQPDDDRAYARLARLHAEAGRFDEARRHYDIALSLYNREPERLSEVGSFLIAVGEPSEAEGLFRRAIDLQPGDPIHHLGMIVSRTRQNHLLGAEQAFEDAVAIGSESADLWHAAGQLSREKQDYGMAQERLHRALELAPDRLDLLLEIGELHTLSGDVEAAVLAYENALIKGVPLEDIADPLVEAYTTLNDEGAADSFVQSLALDTNRTDVVLLAARLYAERGRFQAAVTAYEDALIKGASVDKIAEPLSRAYLNLDEPGAVERILDSVADRPELSAIRGDLYEQTGRLREAVGTYERAIAAFPGDVLLSRRLGSVYEQLGDRTSAAEVYTAALDHAPGDVELLIALGNVLRELDRHRAARTQYMRAIDSDARRADAFLGLGLSAESLNRRAESRQAFRNALRLDPENAVALAGLARVRPPERRRPTPTPSTLIAEARSALNQGDHTTAIDRFRRALSIDAQNGSAWNDLGLAHAAIGETADARHAFESAERLNPTPQAIYNLGRLDVEAGRYENAMAAYKTALERDSAFKAAALNLSALQIQTGHAPSAVLTLKRALAEAPDRGDLRLALANAYLYIQETESARSAYEMAAEDPLQRSAAILGLGNIALSAGDTAAALEHYHEAVREDPKSADPHVNIGSILASQGQFEAAIEAYGVGLEKAPRDLTIYLNLATLYYQAEQYEAALDHLAALLKQSSGVLDAQRLVGHIALATGDPALAIEAYRIALSLSPSDMGSLRGLALACEADERVEDARDAWSRWIDAATEQSGWDAEIERVQNRLDALPGNS